MSAREAVCPACGGVLEQLRLPLDRCVLGRCRKCGHAVTLAGPRHVGESGYATAANARLVFERYYLPARLRSYQVGLDVLGAPDGRVLDYGCNYGDFLVAAAERGWDAFGYEPGAQLRAQAIADVAARIVGSLDQADAQSPYAVVTLWDVLEHLEDLPARFGEFRSLLEPRGRLLVRVPDARALSPRALKAVGPVDHLYLKLCHPVNPEEHYNHFTPESLSAVAERAGFKLEQSISAGYDERVSAGATRVDAAVRRFLHQRRSDWPYEFTAILTYEARPE